MPLKVAILALLLISGCAVYPAAQRDFLGNQMPPACADLSAIDLPVIEVGSVKLWHGQTEELYGGWPASFPAHRRRYIMIPKGLEEPLRSQVIEHEKCHQRRFDLTGSPYWHD